MGGLYICEQLQSAGSFFSCHLVHGVAIFLNLVKLNDSPVLAYATEVGHNVLP